MTTIWMSPLAIIAPLHARGIIPELSGLVQRVEVVAG